MSSGENQLSFLEGDRIALVGDRAKGWQFGENLRTHTFGWFPVAYTELEMEDNHNNWGAPAIRNGHNNQPSHSHHQQQQQPPQPLQHHSHSHSIDQTPDSSLESTVIDEPIPSKIQNAYHEDASPTRMFGDTIMYRQSKQFRRVSGGGAPKPGPPPTLPAPVPTPVVPASYPNNKQQSHISQSHSFSSTVGPPSVEKRKSMPSTTNYSKQVKSICPYFLKLFLFKHLFIFSHLPINQNRGMEQQMHRYTVATTVVLPMNHHHHNQMLTIQMKKL